MTPYETYQHYGAEATIKQLREMDPDKEVKNCLNLSILVVDHDWFDETVLKLSSVDKKQLSVDALCLACKSSNTQVIDKIIQWGYVDPSQMEKVLLHCIAEPVPSLDIFKKLMTMASEETNFNKALVYLCRRAPFSNIQEFAEGVARFADPFSHAGLALLYAVQENNQECFNGMYNSLLHIPDAQKRFLSLPFQMDYLQRAKEMWKKASVSTPVWERNRLQEAVEEQQITAKDSLKRKI